MAKARVLVELEGINGCFISGQIVYAFWVKNIQEYSGDYVDNPTQIPVDEDDWGLYLREVTLDGRTIIYNPVQKLFAATTDPSVEIIDPDWTPDS